MAFSEIHLAKINEEMTKILGTRCEFSLEDSTCIGVKAQLLNLKPFNICIYSQQFNGSCALINLALLSVYHYRAGLLEQIGGISRQEFCLQIAILLAQCKRIPALLYTTITKHKNNPSNKLIPALEDTGFYEIGTFINSHYRDKGGNEINIWLKDNVIDHRFEILGYDISYWNESLYK